MDHIKKYSQIKNRWVLLLVPLGQLTAELIVIPTISFLVSISIIPIQGIIFRIYTSLFWYIAIVIILANLDIRLKTFMGPLPKPRMWLLTVVTIPLFISATFLIPFYKILLQQFLPTLARYIESKKTAPVIYNMLNPTKTLIINSIMGIFLVIIIPIYEEALFRGIVLVRWIHKYGISKAIMLTSFVWGILHYRSFLQSFVFSLVLSRLYVKTKGLYIPMLCHILYNGIIFWLTIK